LIADDALLRIACLCMLVFMCRPPACHGEHREHCNTQPA
jgi:hypothetical protein